MLAINLISQGGLFNATVQNIKQEKLCSMILVHSRWSIGKCINVVQFTVGAGKIKSKWNDI